MAQKTYVQGLVKRITNLSRYVNKHQAKLQAANLPASITAANTAIVAANADAENLLNTYNP